MKARMADLCAATNESENAQAKREKGPAACALLGGTGDKAHPPRRATFPEKVVSRIVEYEPLAAAPRPTASDAHALIDAERARADTRATTSASAPLSSETVWAPLDPGSVAAKATVAPLRAASPPRRAAVTTLAKGPSAAGAAAAIVALSATPGGATAPTAGDGTDGGPLFAREFRLPLDPGFEWPTITHFAFHEHTGALRESWAAERGRVSCSVARRRTLHAPSPNCYHFIGEVYDFLQSCPLVIKMQTSHVTCAPASWSSWKTWPEKVLNGTMLQAAEELLYMLCIGDRAGAEQPPTAHEEIIGPPSFVMNSNEHGGPDKRWLIWERHLTSVAPTSVVPDAERYETLSRARGTPEEKMMARSATWPAMASAITAAWDIDLPPPSDGGRPAHVPCPEYFEWRRAMHHNYGIFAARYAPTLSHDALNDPRRTQRLIILVPMAPSANGPRFLVPMRQGSACFGVVARTDGALKEQAEQAARFISLGIETQHLATVRSTIGDVLVAVPWDVTPLVTVGSTTERIAITGSAAAAWCAVGALQTSSFYPLAMMAVQRILAMGKPATRDDLIVGIWDRARPVVLRQRARLWGQLADDPHAALAWETFLVEERARGARIAECISQTDNGNGAMLRVAASVKTAADYAAELPVPMQGLPTFTDPKLLFVEVPQRPMPLIKQWLHRLPEQTVPPGFQPLTLRAALRDWAIRMMVHSRNSNMKYDAHCFTHGEPPTDARRPRNFTLGKGAAKRIPHDDGIGSYCALDLLLEAEPDGLFYPMRFNGKHGRKWVFMVISAYIGSTTNREILSFLFHGVCWKIDAPSQLRFTHNLERYSTRASAVADAVVKLAESNYVDIVPICRASEGLDVDGSVNPQLYLFQYDVPAGGTDKPDGTARVVGDMTNPHDGHRERNTPDGDADGPVVISANDLSGPRGKPPAGYAGPLPFPDPELKPRPRHKYTAGAVLSHYAWTAQTFLVTHDDDMRHMFFQFFMRKSDLPFNVSYIIVKIEGELWYVAVRNRTMNQGARNASKIACDFAEEWLDAWRREMDVYVASTWLPLQSDAMQSAYSQRHRALGHAQARPFWAAVYTDNFDFTYVGPEIAAFGINKWKAMNDEANIWLQDDCTVGTCSDWIGARTVVTAGIGCVTPSKRERALVNTQKALDGCLTREEYHANNSFLAHVNDACDWPEGSLQGIAGPLAAPGFDDDIVQLTPLATVKYEAAMALLRSRPLASFWSGITDAYDRWAGTGEAQGALIRVHATDCCTDPEPCAGQPNPQPHICGIVNGLYWRYKLTAEWCERHITLTEACGPAIATLLTVPMFPNDINVLATDATSGAAAATWSAHSQDLQSMQAILATYPAYESNRDSIWLLQWKGWGNGLSDAGSRDNMALMQRLAIAFGITLHELPLTPAVYGFMARVLIATRPMHERSLEPEERGAGRTQSAPEYDGSWLLLLAAVCAFALAAMLMRRTNPRSTWSEWRCRTLQRSMHIVYGNSMPLRDVSPPASPLGGNVHPAQPDMPLPGPSRNRDVPPTPPRAHQSHALRNVPATPPGSALPLSDDRVPASRGLTDVLDDAPADKLHVRPGSPQPKTAALARRASHSQIAERLVSNTTAAAICPDDPERLRALVVQAGSARDGAIARGSLGADENGFKWVMSFARDMGPTVRWMRPYADAVTDTLTEVWFCVLALAHIAMRIKPSSKRKARGFVLGQPTSALQALYGWRRVQRDCGRYLCDLAEVRRVLKGICLGYRALYGPEAFMKQQAQVFALAMLHQIAAACLTYAVSEFSAAMHDVWAAKHAFLANTGTRKDEAIRLTRWHFVWVDADLNELPMTPAMIASRSNGDYLRGTSVESKCDPLNLHWGAQRQWFRMDESNPIDFAHCWRTYELKYPCPLSERADWPAFSPHGNSARFTHATSAATHRQLLVAAIGADAAAQRTIHSYRATLASALAKARAEGRKDIVDGVIQVLERWKSVDAMQNYTRMTPATYAEYVHIGTTTDAGSAVRDDIPTIEPTEHLAALDDAVAELETGDAPKVATPAGPSNARRVIGQSDDDGTRDAAPAAATFDVVGGASVTALGRDSWGLVGTTMNIENALWDPAASGSTACFVAAYVGKLQYGGATTKHASYVVTDPTDGCHYPVRASYLVTRVGDPAHKRRLRKQTAPTLIA